MTINEIKYTVTYFKKVIENMDRKELGKTIDDDNHEILTDKLIDTQLTEDEYFSEGLTDWIELIEDINLHNALKSLTIEEQTLLGYIYYKDKTQSEVAKIYGITQKNINKKLHKILNKIKYFLFNR